MTNTIPNIGWAYTKGYYLDFKWRDTREEYQKTFFERKHNALFAASIEDQPTQYLDLVDADQRPSMKGLALQTTYPGLLTGTGMSHQTGSKGESKLGFAFDPCTGLPYLPGSSVKGMLRSSFPQKVNSQKASKLSAARMELNRAFMTQLVAMVLEASADDLEGKRSAYLAELGYTPEMIDGAEEDFIDLLELELFEGVKPAVEKGKTIL